MRRRDVLAGAAALALSAGCRSRGDAPEAPLEGAIHGNHFPFGHQLRQAGGLPEPSQTTKRSVLVVGGGVAGLSAIWRLVRAGVDDIELVELAPTPGGTARGGENAISPFPWGAHYLPVPNPETTLVQRLLKELGLYRPDAPAGESQFDPRHLVFAPEDRLFFRGKWYPGLYLSAGASAADLRQQADFQELTAALSQAVGRDGKPALALPMALSSRDPEFLRYDRLTMATFMDQMGWTSPRLRWTVDYACRDDYGAGLSEVSAWAALHYFAGRRPIQTPETEGTRYFTWPEGNQHLVNWLQALVPHITTGRLVLRVEADGTALAVDTDGRATRYEADQIICATPNHVTERLTSGKRRRFADHAPWLVANLSLDRCPKGLEPGWNNVLYDSPALGFVNTTHQRFGPPGPVIWTWYQAFPAKQRGRLLAGTFDTLSQLALTDLGHAVSRLRSRVTRADLWRWGHGTVIPRPGLISGAPRRDANASMGRVHFAHTDLSGLPLFEEAQYRGVVAAERCLDGLTVPHSSWT